MIGVVVTLCRAATASPAKSPARRPVARTRVNIAIPLVAGEAQRVARIVRGVVDRSRVREARREDEAKAKDKRESRCSQRLRALKVSCTGDDRRRAGLGMRVQD